MFPIKLMKKYEDIAITECHAGLLVLRVKMASSSASAQPTGNTRSGRGTSLDIRTPPSSGEPRYC